ncbi:hypothetical protein LSAT2_015125 [Lamellibrachia satsuma]|nr:hypothetical protein LSAT2_015125 [Lamellibrachia satsuma]
MSTSSTYHKNPNRGPLTLEHDLTPQDLMAFKESLDGRKISPNYRFRGYPVGSFEKPRDPLHNPIINPKELTTEADARHGLQRYFDPRECSLGKGVIDPCVFNQTSYFHEAIRRSNSRQTSKRNGRSKHRNKLTFINILDNDEK